jgi:ankyrin repeat protein
MPLHQAVIHGNLEAVKQLVEAGADVDGQNTNGRTPLQYCQGPGDIAGKFDLFVKHFRSNRSRPAIMELVSSSIDTSIMK